MRHDILQEHKCVHIKLEKDTHAALRQKLFLQGLSMQEAFDEFARCVAEGGRSANSIIETLVARKLREAIDGYPTRRRRRKDSFGELDSESLYSLINGGQNESTSRKEASEEEQKIARRAV